MGGLSVETGNTVCRSSVVRVGLVPWSRLGRGRLFLPFEVWIEKVRAVVVGWLSETKYPSRWEQCCIAH
jgi:hypothetical protein